MKDDMISRQAVLNALNRCTEIYLNNLPPTIDRADAVEAIEALPSAQPGCEDAVSRFEVLRLIDYSSHDLNDAVDNRYMQNEIKQLPSVTPKQPGWIPCSTEMPPTGENVLVTLVDGAVTDGKRWKPQEGKWFLFSDGVNGLDEDVLAWQPLPTPYWEGGQDEQN